MSDCQTDSELPGLITWIITGFNVGALIAILVAGSWFTFKNKKLTKTESKPADVPSVDDGVALTVTVEDEAAAENVNARPEAVGAHHGEQETKEEDGNGAALNVDVPAEHKLDDDANAGDETKEYALSDGAGPSVTNDGAAGMGTETESVDVVTVHDAVERKEEVVKKGEQGGRG